MPHFFENDFDNCKFLFCSKLLMWNTKFPWKYQIFIIRQHVSFKGDDKKKKKKSEYKIQSLLSIMKRLIEEIKWWYALSLLTVESKPWLRTFKTLRYENILLGKFTFMYSIRIYMMKHEKYTQSFKVILSGCMLYTVIPEVGLRIESKISL